MAVIQEELVLLDRFSSTFDRFIQMGDRATAAMDRLSGNIEEMPNRMGRMGSGASAAGTQVDGLTKKVLSLAGAYISLRGAQQLINFSDQMSGINARLNLMVDEESGETVDQLEAKIMASANRSRAAYTDVATTVASLKQQTKGLFNNNEAIAFTEIVNKGFVVSGAGAAEASSALLQLKQAMASGVLQGDELRSLRENAPMLAQGIEAYAQELYDCSDSLKEMAADGKISAEVVKAAVLSMGGEINEQFDAIPMTFAQAMTLVKNELTDAAGPLLEILSAAAGGIANNIDIIVPAVLGLAAAIAIYAIGTKIATIAQNGLNLAFLSSPLFWIALVIGVIIALVYKFISACGGLTNAWNITKAALLLGWAYVKFGFMTGVYAVLGFVDKLKLGWQKAGVAIANFMGDMKVAVLTILQNMINGAIDIINGFIGVLNKIPGVSISTIEHVTFATTAAAENEAAKSARAADLAAYEGELQAAAAERDAALAELAGEIDSARSDLDAALAAAEASKAAAESESDLGVGEPEVPDVGTVGEVGKVKNDVNLADEDLKLLVDLAERKFMNEVNLTTVQPNIQVEVTNSGSRQLSGQEIADSIKVILEQQSAAHTSGTY